MSSPHQTLHQGRISSWTSDELKVHLAGIVEGLAQEGSVSPLEVALDLLGGELGAFVLFGHIGHLDPPRDDGTFLIGILRRLSEDAALDASIRRTAATWASEQEKLS